MPEKRIGWDEYFMAAAHLMSMRSTCERLQVGAILTKDQQVVASGYNGSVSNDDHCIDVGCYIRNNHCQRCLHSEQNCLLLCAKRGISTEGTTIYVTHFPCLQCLKSLIQSGVQEIIYAKDYRNDEYCYHLLQVSGTKIRHVPFDFDYEYNQKSGRLSWGMNPKKKD